MYMTKRGRASGLKRGEPQKRSITPPTIAQHAPRGVGRRLARSCLRAYLERRILKVRAAALHSASALSLGALQVMMIRFSPS